MIAKELNEQVISARCKIIFNYKDICRASMTNPLIEPNKTNNIKFDVNLLVDNTSYLLSKDVAKYSNLLGDMLQDIDDSEKHKEIPILIGSKHYLDNIVDFYLKNSSEPFTVTHLLTVSTKYTEYFNTLTHEEGYKDIFNTIKMADYMGFDAYVFHAIYYIFSISLTLKCDQYGTEREKLFGHNLFMLPIYEKETESCKDWVQMMDDNIPGFSDVVLKFLYALNKQNYRSFFNKVRLPKP